MEYILSYSTLVNSNLKRLLYNDCIWLCDRLQEYISQWEVRDDLPPRIQNLVKLAPEILKLRNFGKRAYKEELTSQRTTIDDLLGGMPELVQFTVPKLNISRHSEFLSDQPS